MGFNPFCVGGGFSPHPLPILWAQPIWKNLSRRIIPAPAGNTSTYSSGNCVPTDHPRACGEHAATCTTPWSSAGSSPRLRGTRPEPWHIQPAGRIIPAPAGNTRRAGPGRMTRPDHPRACGEHVAWVSGAGSRNGSSPRLRGTPELVALAFGPRRIIPAPAGNTVALCKPPWTCSDHPRACGEHGRENDVVRVVDGSSPRLRGTHLQHNRTTLRNRIIPAPAGNTCAARRAARDTADHPRACGEH